MPPGPQRDRTPMAFDRYFRYEHLTQELRLLASSHPRWFTLESIGTSFEGRDIWLMTVTDARTGPAAEKPAVWVDGNIHATELAASMACLYFLRALAERHETDAEVARILASRAFYVAPRLNPDGAELALADVPTLIRSSTRPYPHDEDPVAGLRRADIDHDGRMLTMRMVDPNGSWKVSDRDARLLVRRDPAETGGRYYRLLPEGMIDEFDGATFRMQPRRQQLDLNRNFPAQWRQEHEQHGAGPYPTSEPEVRAAVSFIAAHPNIVAAVAFHTYSGVLLRPYSHLPDDKLPAEDLWTYGKIGAKGTELTGYPNISVFHDFRYHPSEVITGTFDDWMFEHRGVFAWTVEIWSPQREAGIADYKYVEWYREHPVDDDLKLLAWNDGALGGAGFVDWYGFEHPQLGPVEIGGWNPLFTWSNPPPALLEREVARFPEWLLWQAAIAPRLELFEASVVALGDRTWRLRLVVHNTGWLPTYVTKQALRNKLVRGVVFEIAMPDGIALESGSRRIEGDQLEGRAYRPASPSSWSGWSGDVTEDRAKAEWIVRGPAGASVELLARHERAGVVRASIVLN